MKFLQGWKTVLLRMQHLGFPWKRALVKALVLHTWFYLGFPLETGVGQSFSPPYMVLPEDHDVFFCMCALGGSTSIFPWNGNFSLKRQKIIAFRKPAEILHKWILQVSSWFNGICNVWHAYIYIADFKVHGFFFVFGKGLQILGLECHILKGIRKPEAGLILPADGLACCTNSTMLRSLASRCLSAAGQTKFRKASDLARPAWDIRDLGGGCTASLLCTTATQSSPRYTYHLQDSCGFCLTIQLVTPFHLVLAHTLSDGNCQTKGTVPCHVVHRHSSKS